MCGDVKTSDFSLRLHELRTFAGLSPAAGGIQCHTNHDQQAGTAQLNAHTGQVAQNDRH